MIGVDTIRDPNEHISLEGTPLKQVKSGVALFITVVSRRRQKEQAIDIQIQISGLQCARLC